MGSFSSSRNMGLTPTATARFSDFNHKLSQRYIGDSFLIFYCSFILLIFFC